MRITLTAPVPRFTLDVEKMFACEVLTNDIAVPEGTPYETLIEIHRNED